MNTTENNKLIAEFMGLDIFYGTHVRRETVSKLKVTAMKYYSDWNLLMEVVEKIESFERRRYTLITQQNSCLIWDNDNGEELEDFNSSFKAPTKKEAVYNACVEFIKWYNEQKK